jgi:hypothetical protein
MPRREVKTSPASRWPMTMSKRKSPPIMCKSQTRLAQPRFPKISRGFRDGPHFSPPLPREARFSPYMRDAQGGRSIAGHQARGWSPLPPALTPLCGRWPGRLLVAEKPSVRRGPVGGQDNPEQIYYLSQSAPSILKRMEDVEGKANIVPILSLQSVERRSRSAGREPGITNPKNRGSGRNFWGTDARNGVAGTRYSGVCGECLTGRKKR